MEAADDIAYKTADIEDGFKKGLFTFRKLRQFAEKRIKYYESESEMNKFQLKYTKELFAKLKEYQEEAEGEILNNKIESANLYAIQKWIPYVREWLMYCAAYGFAKDEHYKSIMNGKYEYDLFYQTNHQYSVEILKDIMNEFIFPNKSIVKLELAANTIISDLLSKFVPAVLYHDEKYSSNKFPDIKTYKKLYGLLSKNYCNSYDSDIKKYDEISCDEDKTTYDIYLRLLLAIDFVSGMTDSYAKFLYQELNGIY